MINNNFIILVIIVIGLTAGYFYYSSFPSEITINPPLNGKVDDLTQLSTMDLNFSSLSQSKLDALKIFGEYPVNPGATGKRDLFAPIQ